MDEAKLIVNTEKEFWFKNDLTTIGRTSDNTIAFADDSNVSRYHVETE